MEKERRRRSRLVVLRLGHRIPRDQRITTHVCLTARALGVDTVLVADVHDGQLEETLASVVDGFGGRFSVCTGLPWRSTINEWKKSGGLVIHLTAYGVPLQRVISGIRKAREDLMIVVGAEKVPREVFFQADWNVAVTNQPISEVSALGIFLDWFHDHRFPTRFAGARKLIIPSKTGKMLVER